jgi:ABC-2 type transport system ATP-binding protein
MSIVTFDSVSKTFRKGFRAIKVPVVRKLTFSIDTNAIHGFVGANGAGKTTCIKMLLGMVRPDIGSIAIRGISAQNPLARKRVAFVPEQPCFYQHLTARESLEFSYRLSGFPPASMRNAIGQALTTVGLIDQSAKKVHELSKGMQQRLSMAQALSGDADLFVFDEPMSGLDPLGRRLFRTIFRDLARQGKCIFFSTHILEDIETLCDRVIALSHGSLVYSGAISDLLAAGYLGTEIVVAGLAADRHTELSNRGFSLTTLKNDETQIVADNQSAATACLAWLAERSLFPASVTPRRQPIETTLYKNENPEAAS